MPPLFSRLAPRRYSCRDPNPTVQASETRKIVCALDAALEVLRHNQDVLGVSEVRLQSMLNVLKSELLDSLGRAGKAIARPVSARPAYYDVRP